MKGAAVALLLSSKDSTRLWSAALSSQGLGGYGFAPGKRDGLLALRSLLKERRPDAAIIDTPFFAQSGCDAPAEVAQLRSAFSGTRFFLRIPGRVHVSPVEQKWAIAWGAEAILPDTSVGEWQETIRAPLERLLQALGRGEADTGKLATSIRGATDPRPTPRYFADLRVLEQAGLDPMLLLAELRGDGVVVEDRSWRGTVYRECFVAHEAVSLASRRLSADPSYIMACGRVLQGMGLLHHVARQQEFANKELFFRFGAGDSRLDRIALADVVREMRGPGGVEIADRRYLNTGYRRCFVGREAVDWLRKRCDLGIGGAEDLGHRMLELGLLHHVVDEHGFVDGAYFYRFLSDER